MELSQTKLFTFNASSFQLDQSVEDFLRSKGAISLDFGASAYIDSEAMPAIFSELVERTKTNTHSDAELVAQLKGDVGRYDAERRTMMEDNAKLISQARSHDAEIATMKEQLASADLHGETLRAENARLQAALINALSTKPQPAADDNKLKQSYEKLQKEFQVLRAQSAEALASLKVFEDENEELMQELELLKNQSKNTVAPKAC